MNRILVTGGAGYIGSHTCKALNQAGFDPVVYDNFEKGHRWAVQWGPLVEGELADTVRLIDTMKTYAVQGIIHFAAHAYVGESMKDPVKYFRNNVANTVSLMEAMQSAEVSRLIFSSSCATYGKPKTLPITEETQQVPVNPYGESKLIVEKMLNWAGCTIGLKSVALRYFNAAGADPDGCIGEDHDPETHLIPLIIRAARENRKIHVFGTDYPTADGTCVRDYIHVCDLASAHVASMKYLLQGGESTVMNLGTGIGHSVREVISAVEDVSGRKVEVEERPRREGDPPVLIADGSRSRDLLKLEPEYTQLSYIVKTAWDWDCKEKKEGGNERIYCNSRV